MIRGQPRLYRPDRQVGAVANVERIGLRRIRRSEAGASDRTRCKATQAAPDFRSAPPAATPQLGRDHAPTYDPIRDTSRGKLDVDSFRPAAHPQSS
jgi:hypothetical protein